MSIWKTRPVTEQPAIRLARWSIWECQEETTTRYFVGRNISDDEGRVSSPIVEFDLETRRGRTRTGRIYELVGEPGRDLDGDYVFARWQQMYGNQDKVREITQEVMAP